MEEFVILGIILYLLKTKKYVTMKEPVFIAWRTLGVNKSLIYNNNTGDYVYAEITNKNIINSIILFHLIDGVEAYSSVLKGGQSKKILMQKNNEIYGSSYDTVYDTYYTLTIQSFAKGKE
jgi:hypothetical protein